MKITNIMDLPQSFVQMTEKDYKVEPKEYRVTSLLKSTREAILERRHDSEIERDVSDMIWLIFGTAVHGILEKYHEAEDEFKETRIKLPFGDYLISGQFDLYKALVKLVTDYKTASVWKIMFGDYNDWRRQLLIYCYMLRKLGFEANAGEIVALLKDHSKRDAKFKENYPQLPVQKIRFEFTEEDFEECEVWLTAKFEEIKKAEALPDDELPLCTPEERFNSGDKYAVMKKGRKTALRVLDSMEDAQTYMAEKGGDEIQVRPGEDKKCKDYCSACLFCNYYKEVVANEGDIEEAC